MGKIEIVKTTPVELSAVQIDLVVAAIRQTHIIHHHEMHEPEYILRALQRAKEKLAMENAERRALLESISDEEIDLIRKHRAG